MKTLVIEDEKRLAKILKQGLEENAFAVDLSYDGEEGLSMAEAYPYDAVLLDVMLPRMDGFTVLSTLRATRKEVPVLIISARGEVDDRIRGLNTGADDYITKPFDFFELLARLKSVIRRNKGRPSPLLMIDDLIIDMNSRTVSRANKKISLTPNEYALLEYLALNRGRVVGRAELRERLCNAASDRDSNVIDVHITHLRSKIDKDFDRQIIYTLRGEGYVVREDA
jgi:DNA-binding response OmpR family regulator